MVGKRNWNFATKFFESIAQPEFSPVPPVGWLQPFAGTVSAYLAHQSGRYEAKPELAPIGPTVVIALLTAWFAKLLCLEWISLGTVGV